MLQNYLKIAWRHLLTRPSYFAVNSIGLAIGMTFALLVGSFVWSEMQVNDNLTNADNQYIIRSKWKLPGLGYEDVTVAPLGKKLRQEYPGLVANYYRFDVLTTAVSRGDNHFVRETAQAGDPTMMAMYGFRMLSGNPQTALKEPNSVVITEENAMRYFGKTDVLGQVLQLSNYVGGQQNFVVTGVLKSLPKNSITYLWDLPVNLFIPLNSLEGRTEADGWMTWNVANYIELKEGITPQDLKKPIETILAAYAPKEVNENLQPYLSPLKSYYRNFNDSIVRKTIYTLSGIALFILLMAIANFVNSTIADSPSRIKEIGIRRAMGSLRNQLIAQFLSESIVVSTLSMILSLVFYELFRSYFGAIIGKQIDSLWTVSPHFLGASIASALLIGTVAGLYPAFILSALSVVDSLKGKLKSVKEGLLFRQFLMTAQFAIALLVTCGAVIVAQQVSYLFSNDLGYSRESILLVALPRDWTPRGVAKIETVRNELARLSVVSDISTSSSTLKGGTGYDIKVYPVGKDSTQAIATSVIQTDEHFISTYQIRMRAGQFFRSSERAQQEDKIVLNEIAVKSLGFKNPEAAIGKQLYSQGYKKPITIIGVTNDFSFRSMREKVMPMAISHINGAGNLFAYFSVKLNVGNVPASVAVLEQRFHQLLPNEPFDFSFTDDALQQLYESELQLKSTVEVATLLALVIVLSSILSMVALAISRRTREVGIRKVLGASGQSIVLLFLNEFLLTLLLAVFIAFPIAYLIMQKWVQSFAYHINISLSSFIGVGLLFFMLIGLIVSVQTFKTALMNPVKSLRSE